MYVALFVRITDGIVYTKVHVLTYQPGLQKRKQMQNEQVQQNFKSLFKIPKAGPVRF